MTRLDHALLATFLLFGPAAFFLGIIVVVERLTERRER